MNIPEGINILKNDFHWKAKWISFNTVFIFVMEAARGRMLRILRSPNGFTGQALEKKRGPQNI